MALDIRTGKLMVAKTSYKTLIIHLTILAFLHLSLNGFSQISVIDSLEKALVLADQDQKIPILQTLSWDLKHSDTPKALAYANEGLALSPNPSKDYGIFLKTIAVVYSISGEFELSDEFTHKAIDVFQTTENLKLEGTCWSITGINCRQRAMYDCALQQFNRAYDLAKVISDSINMAKSKGNIANVYLGMGQYPKAIEMYQQVIAFAKASNDELMLAANQGNLARTYSKQGEYLQAIELFSKSLSIYLKSGNKGSYANCLNGIGIILEKLEMYPEAVEIFNRALTLEQELGNNSRKGKYLNNIGSSYIYLKEFDLALDAIQASIRFYENAGIQASSSQFINLAICYLHQGEFERAYPYLERAHQQALKKERRHNVILATEVKGRVALAQDSLEKAEELLLSAYQQWEQLGEPFSLHSAALYLSELYEKRADFKTAFQYQKQVTLLEDSLFNMSENMKITQVLVRERLIESGQITDAEDSKSAQETISTSPFPWLT